MSSSSPRERKTTCLGLVIDDWDSWVCSDVEMVAWELLVLESVPPREPGQAPDLLGYMCPKRLGPRPPTPSPAGAGMYRHVRRFNCFLRIRSTPQSVSQPAGSVHRSGITRACQTPAGPCFDAPE